MFDLFWEVRQQRDISSAASDAAASASRATSAERQVQQVSERLDRLSLICMAMWSLLQEKTELTEEELIDRVQELDAQDGVLDGKAQRPAEPCPHCKRPISQQHQRCLYCGFVKSPETAFDAI